MSDIEAARLFCENGGVITLGETIFDLASMIFPSQFAHPARLFGELLREHS
jgi:hypothetical protein